MPNWDVPDYDPTEKIDYEGLWARIRAEGGMTEWPYQVADGASPGLVKMYCVDTTEPFVQRWQDTRLSMKGKPTHQKLDILMAWWYKFKDHHDERVQRAVGVQVVNYLGALRRGGQLNEHNQVRKYL